VVVISGAAGAVGSIAGQLARLKGVRLSLIFLEVKKSVIT